MKTNSPRLTTVQCERCSKDHKHVDTRDITCPEDLKAGICQECLNDNLINMALFASDLSTKASLLKKLQRFQSKKEITEYKTICDQVLLPNEQ